MTDPASHNDAAEGRPASWKRRRKRRVRLLVALSIVALAVTAIVFEPLWRPFIATTDEARITAERGARHFRFTTGTEMPGQPDLTKLPERLAANGLDLGAPVLMRIFKNEFELELWMKRGDSYTLFTTYPICMWSGKLGPKFAEGDHQAPEGFYTVARNALNPNSRWHRSFNLGYPNTFDRTHGRTGSALMVHGNCASVGCYAMTDPQIDEIWRLINAAFDKGQTRFQVQIYPFRMTDEHLKARAENPAADFWQTLKPGYDAFERTKLPPKVSVCRGQYQFTASTSQADDSNPEIVAACNDTASGS